MDTKPLVIETNDLVRLYGEIEGVNGLNLSVASWRCYGFFGRNGAGKTTTIKCLLNLLRPTSGTVRLFGMYPQLDEVPVKTRLAYVPDEIAVYPWMSIQQYFEFLASFGRHWNTQIECDLLD